MRRKQLSTLDEKRLAHNASCRESRKRLKLNPKPPKQQEITVVEKIVTLPLVVHALQIDDGEFLELLKQLAADTTHTASYSRERERMELENKGGAILFAVSKVSDHSRVGYVMGELTVSRRQPIANILFIYVAQCARNLQISGLLFSALQENAIQRIPSLRLNKNVSKMIEIRVTLKTCIRTAESFWVQQHGFSKALKGIDKNEVAFLYKRVQLPLQS
jgi:hypothetical protein